MTTSFRRLTAAAAATSLLLAPLALTLTTPRSAAAQTMTAAQQTAAAGTYTPDKPHSSISFTVMHLGIDKVHGRFNDFDGTVVVDGKKIESSTVAFSIKVDSVDTDNAQRDAHLKTDTFFDAAKYPEITFKSTRVNKRPAGYAATGMLTMHGISKQVVLPFTVVGPVRGMEKGLHLGISTSLTIKRSDYGVRGYLPAVGDDIPITIDLDLIKDGSVPAKAEGK